MKRPGRAVDYCPWSNAEVKNEWILTSAPPICHHGVDRDKFTFYLFMEVHNFLSLLPNFGAMDLITYIYNVM
jgi:hypothetical protein